MDFRGLKLDKSSSNVLYLGKRKGVKTMLRNLIMLNPMKYLTHLHPVERRAWKLIAYVVGAVMLFMLLLDASALGLIVFFAIGWYAKSKYDLKQKKVAKKKKKIDLLDKQ
jgi:hypothetical protein